jgi:hypothetical protein
MCISYTSTCRFFFQGWRENMGRLQDKVTTIHLTAPHPAKQLRSNHPALSKVVVVVAVKVAFSHYRPSRLLGTRRLRLPDFLDFQHYEGRKVVTLTHRPPLPPGVSWY